MCHTDIQRSYGFTYTECSKLVDQLTIIKGKLNEVTDDKDAKELQGYMKQFMVDVDTQYETSK